MRRMEAMTGRGPRPSGAPVDRASLWAAVAFACLLAAGTLQLPLHAQQSAGVHLMRADGDISVARSGGGRVATPRPPLPLEAGDQVHVGADGFALLLYPAGPVKLWPGDVHTVVFAPVPAEAGDGRSLWQRIARTVAAMTGAPEADAPVPRQGVSILRSPRQGVAARPQRARLLLTSGDALLSDRPRFHYLSGSAASPQPALRIAVHAVEPGRCWRAGTLIWADTATSGVVPYPATQPPLDHGVTYRVELSDQTGTGAAMDAACVTIESPEMRQHMTGLRAGIAGELQDPTDADVLWAAFLLDAGRPADALHVLHDVLERQPRESTALALREHILRQLLRRIMFR